jgi:photosystem II stability/assembly factor-like uncharacterized protein
MRKYFKWALFVFGPLAIVFFVQSNKNSSAVNKHEAYAEYLSQHPMNQDENWTAKKLEGTAKADRPDLAYQQNFIMTMDPALGYPTPERLLLARARLEASQNSFRQKMAADSAQLPDLVWEERGPFDVGGRTRAIMYDPNDLNGRKVWAGGVSGGLWYNNDIQSPNSTWVPVGETWQTLAVSCITFDPTNPLVFYVGTGEGIQSSSYVRGQGLWKTSDGGITWAQLPASIPFDFVNDVAVRNENGNGVLYVAVRDVSYAGFEPTRGSDEGLYRSIDGGLNFTQVMDTVTGTNYTWAIGDIEIGADNRIWLGSVNIIDDGTNPRGGGDILFSDDGLNFTRVRNTNGERVEIAVAPSNAAYVYALIEKNGLVDKILRSVDSGATWTNMPEPNDDDPGIPASDFSRGQAWYDLIIQVDPNDESVVYVGGVNLFRSQDTANSWQQISHWYGGFGYPNVHADQHQIIFKPGSSSEVLFGHDGGVTISTNINSANPSFLDRNAGYNVTQFYYGDIAPTAGSNDMVAGSQDNGTQRFTQPGLSVTNTATGGDGAACFIDELNSNFWITSYVYNAYWRSYNNGGSFGNRFINNSDGRFINPTDYDPDKQILYSCKNAFQVYRYSNVTSQVVEEDIRITGLFDRPSRIRTSPYFDSVSTIWVGSGAGVLFRVDSADTDGQEVLHNITGVNFPTGYLSDIEVGENEDELIVCFANYGVSSLWYTSDNGQSWLEKEGDLPDMPVRSVIINPRDKNNVILGTDLGIWESHNFLDASPTWAPANNGMPNVRVDQLQLRKSDYTIMAITHGRGVFTSQFKGGLSLDESAGGSTNLSLQVYPNPSNDAIQLNFKEAGIWEMEVYNVQGQKVYGDRWSSKSADQKYYLNQLKAGVYQVVLRKGADRYTQSLLLQ